MMANSADCATQSAAGTSVDPQSLVADALRNISMVNESPEAAHAVTLALALMKQVLYGSPDRPADKRAGEELASAMLDSELLSLLLARLPSLEFECRKDVAQVLSNLLRKQLHADLNAVSWLERSPEVLLGLVRSYERPEVALNNGLMLREAIRHERLASILLNEEETFSTLFRCVESPHFDVASDAFATCRELLTRHKALVAEFLSSRYDAFFAQYLTLVLSTNYVTRRQSLKLLSELLLDRSNFGTMTRFIASVEHLKAVMNLLRDRSNSIQYEAFHVFKVFVANPRKEPAVLELLRRNRERLLTFLDDFLNQRESQDEHFRDEKLFLKEEIRKL